MPQSFDLTYPKILSQLEKHLAEGRTESRAFLAWFLEHYYRLEEVDAHDAVCDGIDDKGCDGIYVDDNLERIDIFQSRLVRNPKKTLGDTQLKEFVGTLAQFKNPNRIQEIAETTGNLELKNLIESEKIVNKVKEDYSVRGVFIINVARDQNAETYLASQPELILYDKVELKTSYVPAEPSAPMTKAVTFDVYGYDDADYQIGDTRVIVAPLSATELIKLDGLASGELFVWNVRQSLGRTKVNKEIGKSVEDQSEHANFLLYHNGLTILCRSIERDKDKITISGYSVVNGCQSLTSLYEHKTKVSSDLRLLSRLIELSPESDLAAKITHHSNNQNPINARDLQSNSSIQRRLQNEFADLYSGKVFYRIKRGEQTDIPTVIDNEEAGRILLAFDLKEPWTCHQTYKLFDELHSDIFARPEVNADRIIVAQDLYEIVTDSLPKISHQLMARYRLTRFFLLFLLRQALEQDVIGSDFCRNPGIFLHESRGRIRLCFNKVLNDIIIDLNAEINEREENKNPIDYKRELKSPSAVRAFEKSIISSYKKGVARRRASAFGMEWKESAA
jgi:hypothetical protein